ncbi:undecaprenyl-diphosphate phosphatase [Paralimibaculum aggregatum]|uniref:Undecaprenyl-diphosphatase n=1 Tax=Paralimibaculum aggregatum TaxID=3036245 RepID=A0ABQ6LNV4_9RHOB|nr:undecaprenyl-diphosphate phosphatase [Limibaculum sp. NKW23]GMG84901.1 undecaprenyl-diphosphate phosphatase [Limibaculum sp. NKW23]
MSAFDLVMLALIQGITEFLPVSSSGHLALWPLLTSRADQGVTMDVAVHLGTLVAVCAYFRGDVGRVAVGAGHILGGRPATAEARLAWLLALATVPAVVAGLALKLAGAMEALRSIEVIGWTTLTGGILLWLADRLGRETRDGAAWTWRDAGLMGLAQALALIPGTSRSGACMTMARALGYRRDEAARLALLMAVPTILAAGTVETAGLVAGGNLRLGADFAIGAALAGLAAWAALAVMMRMFRGSWTMAPFALYRLALGLGLLALAYA